VIELTLAEARGLTVAAQRLDGSAPPTPTEVVRALGSVQIDPVAAVARAERMVLFSRLGPYDVSELGEALSDGGELYEYWAHIVPVSDFGIHREVMRRYPRGDRARSRYIREWNSANASFRRYILRELRRRGPLLSRDLEDRAVVQWRTGGWNDGKALGRMLDILWFGGEIAIVGRDGNERVWDLASRRLPRDEPRWRQLDVARAVVGRGLERLGVARRDQFGRTFDGPPPGADEALRALVREGIAVPARIRGLEGEWWAHRDVLERGFGPGRTVLLSPFDRLVYDRERTAELFGFRYRLEMYVPAAKREYGYYVLPILHGTELIGRIEPVFDRKTQVLSVRGVWAERAAPADAGRDVAAALLDLARWLGAERIDIDGRTPRMWSKALRA
jgi:uncharacterized protein YcaQ